MKDLLKKISVFITVFLFAVIFIIPDFGVLADETTTTTTTNTTKSIEGSPKIVISSVDGGPFKAGKTQQLSIKLKNVSEYKCYDLTATVVDENGKFDFPSGTVNEDNRISAGSSLTISYDIKPFDYIFSGRYPLKLELSGENRDGIPYSNTLTFYVDVESSARQAGLEVSSYSTDKVDVKDGDAFLLTVKLKNNSGMNITGAKISLGGLDGTKFAMNNGLSSYTVDVAKDAEISLQFPLVACKGIASIREVLPLNISYYINPNDAATKQEYSSNITISCAKPAETTSTTEPKVFAPKIIIEKYSFGGDYVTGGKTFPLALTIKNTSSNAQIQNLKVTIQGGSSSAGSSSVVAFTPANSSNSFFFKALNANASENINIEMLAKADATPNSYPIEVVFNYEYTVNGRKGDSVENVTETINIPLQQEDRLEVNQPELQETGMVGQEMPISVGIVNKGKSSVYNVTVDIVGEGFTKTSAAAYYIGNIDSGKEESYDNSIVPNAEGQVKGEIVVTYEDSNGKQKEIRKEFSFNAMQMVIDDPSMTGSDMPVNGDVGNNGTSPVLIIIIVVVGAVVLGAAGFVAFKIIKKRKLKKAQEIEDDDEVL